MSKVSNIFGGILGITLAILYIWGVGWSFHRNGLGHGAIALLIPPYGVYRGIASAWDDPEWKVKYDIRIEQLAIAIEYSKRESISERTQSVEVNHLIKDWVKQIPKNEQKKLEEASKNYGLAILGCSRMFASSLIDNRVELHPCQNSTIHQRVVAFQSISGFNKSWNKFVQQADSDAKSIETQKRGDPIDAGSRERFETHLINMDTKMNGTINEIFSAP